ncbi:Rap1a/Tai family immunity protein [Burkholderia anthina]|uniref:Rap1a/Tai family immunity protein n=1 Tax=Burkholderia anthina TaxID=179879 RepID=UPI00158E2618|nr:Rap1a/Tai family immunity protein [Burkholderia anthina]
MSVLFIRSVFLVASLSASIGIAHGAAVPRVDGTRLLDGMSRTDNTPYADAERHAMTGYLAGVADTTEGKDWCDNGRVKPGEIDSEVLGDLRKLSNGALRANAAGLVTRILRQKYPCR